ncbi:Nn.00g108280.m01.CDS01 [Neocucurbitaria sp. VM-36]
MDRPQVSIPPAANVLGTIGTGECYESAAIQYANHTCSVRIPALSSEGDILTKGSVQLLVHPDHPTVSFFVTVASTLIDPREEYGIIGGGRPPKNFNFALKFQPQAFAGLTLIAWGQTLYYHNKWRVWTATLATIALAGSFALMEMILILTLRGPYSRGVEWPMMLMAISASVIQVIGLIPPYFELAKRNGRVIGINFWFLIIDYAGAFFSLMAIIAQQWFDALGASLYIACMVLETGIFLSQAIWLWRVRHIRCEAKKAGQTYDQYITKHPSKKLPRSDSQETVVDVEACHESKESNTYSEKIDTTTSVNNDCSNGQNCHLTPNTARLEEGPQRPPVAVVKSSGSG